MESRVWNRAGIVALALLMLVVPLFCPSAYAADTGVLKLKAKAAILIEYTGGRTLYEYNADQPLPIASITKIMTMILALEALESGAAKLDDLLTTSEHAYSMGGSQIWLEIGEQMSLKDILYAVGVGSANDAAVCLAEYLAGSEEAFVAQMNEKARSLGMTNTRFANSSGLPPDSLGMAGAVHQSSARDVAIMSRYAMKFPLFRDMVSTYRYAVREGTKSEVVLWSFNKMLDRTLDGRRYGYQGLDGIKTGMTTEAGYCLSASAVRDNLRLIAVVLGNASPDEREEDVRSLLDYGFRMYKAEQVGDAGKPVTSIEIAKSHDDLIPVFPKENLFVTVPRTGKASYSTRVEIEENLSAPLPAGERVGELIVFDDAGEIARMDLVTRSEVKRGSILRIIFRIGRKVFKGLFAGSN